MERPATAASALKWKQKEDIFITAKTVITYYLVVWRLRRRLKKFEMLNEETF